MSSPVPPSPNDSPCGQNNQYLPTIQKHQQPFVACLQRDLVLEALVQEPQILKTLLVEEPQQLAQQNQSSSLDSKGGLPLNSKRSLQSHQEGVPPTQPNLSTKNLSNLQCQPSERVSRSPTDQPTAYLSQLKIERDQQGITQSRAPLRQSLPHADIPATSSQLMSRLSVCHYRAPSQMERGSKMPSVRFPDGSIYDGEWKDDQPHGIGDIHLRNGSIFTGTFVNGLAIGKGRLITLEGDVYEGTIVQGRAEGYGIYESADTQTRYQGQFLNNLPHGKGKMTDSNGCYFKGTFKHGQRQKGHLVWGFNQEYSYEGQFINQVFWGLGVLTSPQGVYKGWFINGKKHERGVFTWKDGRKYQGRYANDAKNGEGILYNSDGSISYKGSWANDLPHGKGMGSVDGEELKGVWKHGKFVVKKVYPS